MKKINLFVALVATLCLICSCGEEKATITLYEVENGDTIEVEHEITYSEVQEWLVDGYQPREDSEFLRLKYNNKDEIPSVIELVAFLSCFDDIKVEEGKIRNLKELVQTIHRPVEAQVFIYSDDNNHICIYSIDNSQPQISMGVCTKRDGFNEYCAKMKEVDGFSDYNETELQYVTMLTMLGQSATPFYFTARNFESKSGVISRLMTGCVPK